MRHLAVLAVIALTLTSGCCTGRRGSERHAGAGEPRHGKVRTTPLDISGPVNVSGPVTVSGPVSVSGARQGDRDVAITGGVSGAPGSAGATTGASGSSARSTPVLSESIVVHGAPGSAAGAAAQAGDDVHLELKTEDLTVQRNTVSNGAARIRKYVVSEEKSIPVTLRRETFTVERVPASGAPTTLFGPGESVIDLPLTTETAVGVVTPRVTEILRVRKTVETDRKEIKAILRTEKADITKAQ